MIVPRPRACVTTASSSGVREGAGLPLLGPARLQRFAVATLLGVACHEGPARNRPARAHARSRAQEGNQAGLH